MISARQRQWRQIQLYSLSAPKLVPEVKNSSYLLLQVRPVRQPSLSNILLLLPLVARESRTGARTLRTQVLARNFAPLSCVLSSSINSMADIPVIASYLSRRSPVRVVVVMTSPTAARERYIERLRSRPKSGTRTKASFQRKQHRDDDEEQ